MKFVLFPCDYMDDTLVDPDFREEYVSTKNVGFMPILYDYDAWFEVGFLDIKENFDEPIQAILRGWKMMPSMYQRLYKECLKKNIKLINSPEQYENLEVFNKIYP